MSERFLLGSSFHNFTKLLRNSVVLLKLTYFLEPAKNYIVKNNMDFIMKIACVKELSLHSHLHADI